MKFGVIGSRLAYSLSPPIHKKTMELKNINAEYAVYQVKPEDAGDIVNSLRVLGIDGANVTMPYKQIVMEQLDYISDEAKKIGSINTIHIVDGKASGYNTDYYGIECMLKMGGIEVDGNDFYILGGGGSAKAVIAYLTDNKASNIVVVSRNKDKAKADNPSVETMTYDEFYGVKKGYCVVNTTPVGMSPNVDESPIEVEKLSCFEAAVDLIYTPEDTKFILAAKERGLKAISGLYMLVTQAIVAEKIWHGFEFDREFEMQVYEYTKNYIAKSKQVVYLIGFMGAGKTSIGKKLASTMGMKFVDIDEKIEQMAGTSIKEIFETHGEQHFRELEHKAIVAQSGEAGVVIATGGGCVTYPKTYNYLQDQNCIYLKYSIDTLYSRIEGDASRPLVDTKESLHNRLSAREPMYRALSRLTIDGEELDIAQITYKIQKEMRID
ncbi:MAG: shikimate dehydrogenase [Epulopiscium sp. Nele67-Bin004]|nr:MAG: shikimate dehydrogenase [Epulopiscium sp. Nele67-Bin004]